MNPQTISLISLKPPTFKWEADDEVDTFIYLIMKTEGVTPSGISFVTLSETLSVTREDGWDGSLPLAEEEIKRIISSKLGINLDSESLKNFFFNDIKDKVERLLSTYKELKQFISNDFDEEISLVKRDYYEIQSEAEERMMTVDEMVTRRLQRVIDNFSRVGRILVDLKEIDETSFKETLQRSSNALNIAMSRIKEVIAEYQKEEDEEEKLTEFAITTAKKFKEFLIELNKELEMCSDAVVREELKKRGILDTFKSLRDDLEQKNEVVAADFDIELLHSPESKGVRAIKLLYSEYWTGKNENNFK